VLLFPAAAVLAAAVWIGIAIATLPSVSRLASPRATMVITVKDWKGHDHPFVVGPRNPYWTPYGAIPPALKKAVVASEDANFYSHEGIDYEAMKEAIRADLEKGRFVRGGSTITQQLAKNLFLSREKTITRKIKELILARRLDDKLSKARILELYLNVVELGPMVYGVGHASRYYFGKPPSALTVRECSFLAAMLPGPKVYNPYRKMERVVKRSDRILRRMVTSRMITRDEYEAALSERPNLSGLEKKVETTLAVPPAAEENPAAETGEGQVIGTPGPGPAQEPAGRAPAGR
jgi:monofunctional biosynthetic peptidoglycan transglycosylase